MLNIIHRLKPGMLPALFFLTSASVPAQPLIIPPGHWQEGMTVGMTEFSGTLYVPEVSWQWQPHAARMSTAGAVQAAQATGKDGMAGQYHCWSGLERGQRRGDSGDSTAGETPVMAGERL
ncbi:hypothetical protein Q0T09_22970 [Escherichia coli B12:H4]